MEIDPALAGGAGSPGEDARVWIGRVREGSDPEHEAFVAWLKSDAGAELFRRRRLTDYRLVQAGRTVTVVFKAPHTGDPRLMIDFLRYPQAWPEFWEFERGGRADADSEVVPPEGRVLVHWRREGGRGVVESPAVED